LTCDRDDCGGCACWQSDVRAADIDRRGIDLNGNTGDESNCLGGTAEGGCDANGCGEGRVKDGVYEAAEAIAGGRRAAVVVVIVVASSSWGIVFVVAAYARRAIVPVSVRGSVVVRIVVIIIVSRSGVVGVAGACGGLSLIVGILVVVIVGSSRIANVIVASCRLRIIAIFVVLRTGTVAVLVVIACHSRLRRWNRCRGGSSSPLAVRCNNIAAATWESRASIDIFVCRYRYRCLLGDCDGDLTTLCC